MPTPRHQPADLLPLEGKVRLLQDDTTTYVYGDRLLYSVDTTNTATYLVANKIGSTTSLVNQAGNIIASNTYDAWGGLRSATSSANTEFTFTGEQHDQNGLEYLRARYYDDASGRLLSRDPAGEGNPYAYAGGNPVMNTDPSGTVIIYGYNGSGFVNGGTFWPNLYIVSPPPPLAPNHF